MGGLHEAAFGTLLRGSDDLILVIDPTGRVLDAGARAQARLAPGGGLAGSSLPDLLTPESGQALREFLPTLADDGAIALKHRDTSEGPVPWVRYAVHAIPGAGQQRGFLLVGRDVLGIGGPPTPAGVDPLTGLADRGRLALDLARLVRSRGPHSDRPLTWVIMADLDHFKAINDTHGHLFGDAVLAGIARTLADHARPGDTVARFGGDEFVLAGQSADRREPEELAARLLEAIRGLSFIPPGAGRPIRVTISAGVSAAQPGPDRSPDALLAAADRALYRAKTAGRDRVEFGS